MSNPMVGYLLVFAVVGTVVGTGFLAGHIYRSRNRYHRMRMVVAWPETGHVPRPVPCTSCDGTGMRDKRKNSFGVPATPGDKSRLWKKLLFSHGTARDCGDCRGAGFRASEELPSPHPKARHQP